MEQRIKNKLKRDTKPGTLICCACGSEDNLVLYEGGRCRPCWPGYLIGAVKHQYNPKPVQQQLKESIELLNRIELAMGVDGINQTQMAARIGITENQLSQWRRGLYARKGQEIVNTEIRRYFDEKHEALTIN